MRSRALAWTALALCLSPAVRAAELQAELRDPAFAALEDELARARDLTMEGADKPYYLRATLNDEETFQVSASFGALVQRASARRSTSGVMVRVGDPSLDNGNFADDDWGFLLGGRGRGTPVEPEYDALRRALWLQFDDGYKKALEALAKKRAYLQANQAENRPPDFAPAATATLVQPRQPLVVDQERWTRLVRAA